MVMLFHGPGAPLRGGFFGVDVFFVLSGFLITTLLLAEHAATGRIAIGRFWLRRALRLLPALLLVCGAMTVVGLGAGSPEMTEGIPAVLLYVGNWARGTLIGGPLEHMWSLAIEEQFYIVWPAVFLLLLRFGRRVALAVTLSAVIGSAVWRAVLWTGPPSYLRVYNGTDTRADGLLLGCALALAVSLGLVQRLPARTLHRLAGISALGIGIAALTGSDRAVSTYQWEIAAVGLGAALLILCVTVLPNRRLVAAFSNRHLVATGGLSYGLYLWNLPVNCLFGKVFELVPWLVSAPCAIAISFLMAHLSLRLVEEPALRLRDRLASTSRPRAVRASGR